MEQKIKLGYFTEGFDKYQAPIKRYIAFAENHDKDKFDVTFYSRFGPDDAGLRKEAYKETIEYILSLGHRVVIDLPTKLFEIIKQDKLNIFASHIATALPGLTKELRDDNGTKIIQFALQQPTNSPLPDITIHHSPTTIQHERSEAVLLESRYIEPQKTGGIEYTKSDFGVPEDALLLMSTGRQPMFQSQQYWKAIKGIIDTHNNVYLMAIGCETPNGHSRIISMGFQPRVYDLLQTGDIYLDTFPLGGGWALAEAVFAGLPCVTFEANLQPFDFKQATLPEILSIPELTIRRWWMGSWATLVKRLISDEAYRASMAEKVAQRAKVIGNYEEYIRQVEDVYVQQAGYDN